MNKLTAIEEKALIVDTVANLLNKIELYSKEGFQQAIGVMKEESKTALCKDDYFYADSLESLIKAMEEIRTLVENGY